MLNSGIKAVKKYLESKTGLDHTREFERFSCLLSGLFGLSLRQGTGNGKTRMGNGNRERGIFIMGNL